MTRIHVIGLNYRISSPAITIIHIVFASVMPVSFSLCVCVLFFFIVPDETGHVCMKLWDPTSFGYKDIQIESTDRWAYSEKDKSCIEFKYLGCLGTSNNYESEELCQSKCISKFRLENMFLLLLLLLLLLFCCCCCWEHARECDYRIHVGWDQF